MRLAFVLVVCLVTAQGQPKLNVPKEWRGKSAVELLKRTDFNQLPFYARDTVLLDLDTQYQKLPWESARDMLFDAEKAVAPSERRDPTTSVAMWSPENENCTTFLDRDERFFVSRYAGAVITVSLGEYEKYYSAWVSVELAPGSKVSVDIMPRNVSLAAIDPRVSLLRRIDAREMAKKATQTSILRRGLQVYFGGGGRRTATSTTTGTYRGTNGNGTYSESTQTTYVDPVARAQAIEEAQAAEALKIAKANGIMNTALLAKTLTPGQKTDGFLYFERDKMTSGVLRIQIGRVSFEFPLAAE